jgi:HK97 family phage major capsid protein
MEAITKTMHEMNQSMAELRRKFDEKAALETKGQETDSELRLEIKRLQERADETEEKYKAEIASHQEKTAKMYEQVRETLENTKAQANTPQFSSKDIPALVRGLAFKNWGDKGEYMGIQRMLRHAEGSDKYKALIDETASSGGRYLIPETWATEVIPLIYPKEEFFSLPVGRKNPSGGMISLPRITGGAVAYMVAAAEAITTSNVTAGKDTLSPLEVAVLSPVDNRVVRRADSSIQQVVQQDMTKAVAKKLVSQYLDGDGSAGNMTGLEHQTGIQEVSMGTHGAKFTAAANIDNLMRLPRAIEGADGVFEQWLMNTRSKWDLREVKDGQGKYLLTVPDNSGDPPLLIGYPYKISNNISNVQTQGSSNDCTSIYGGMWSEVITYIWTDIQFEASREGTYVIAGTTYSAFQMDMTLFRMVMEANIHFRNPVTIGRIKGIRPNTAA